jgi:ATP-dependent DNA helicase RecQ
MMTDLRAALQSFFGYEEFRPYQREIVEGVMAGRDVLGVLPTGAGKSLCFQLPALLQPRTTLVISPLIALMKDQLDGLPPEVYPRATLVNSSLEPAESARRIAAAGAGQYRLVYIAPERLRNRAFLHAIARAGLSRVVVDEAHCVSVWGHDFRPDYLFIRKALAELGHPPVLAVTATATPEMQREIGRQLGREFETVIAPAFRPNLRFEVVPCAGADDKMRRLAAICKETRGSTIVYANSRERCEQLAAFLRRERLGAVHYHAGLETEERRTTQERFMVDEFRIIVATVAFGMGVDKANVRLVVHFNLPESLEAYAQEAGRAGRDGRPSRCVLLYAPSDKANLSRWLRREELTLEAVRQVYRALQGRLGSGAGPVAAEPLKEEAPALGESDSRVAISVLEQIGLIRRHPDLPSSVGLRLLRAEGGDPSFAEFCGAAGLTNGAWQRAAAMEWSRRTGVPAPALEPLVLRWQDAGLLEVRADGREMLIEMLPPPQRTRADTDALLAARRRHAEARIAEIVGYAEGEECRHVLIAAHFGQHLDPCGDVCDVCLGTVEEAAPAKAAGPTPEQVPDLGRALLETVAALPFPMGRTGLVKTATGAADSVVKADRCPCYGVLSGMPPSTLGRHVEQLVADGFLARDEEDEYRRLSLTARGREALEQALTVIPNTRRATPAREKSRRPERRTERRAERREPVQRIDVTAQLSDEAEDRFERLRAWRRIEAQRANLPPYVIFHDATLREIAVHAPKTAEELGRLHGMGPARVERYGEAVLRLLWSEDSG